MIYGLTQLLVCSLDVSRNEFQAAQFNLIESTNVN